MLDASLYSEAAFYRGVLKVPALPRADYCSLLWQKVFLDPFPLLTVVVATMTLYSWEVDFSRQQVIWLNVGKVSVLKELLVFPRTEMG